MKKLNIRQFYDLIINNKLFQKELTDSSFRNLQSPYSHTVYGYQTNAYANTNLPYFNTTNTTSTASTYIPTSTFNVKGNTFTYPTSTYIPITTAYTTNTAAYVNTTSFTNYLGPTYFVGELLIDPDTHHIISNTLKDTYIADNIIPGFITNEYCTILSSYVDSNNYYNITTENSYSNAKELKDILNSNIFPLIAIKTIAGRFQGISYYIDFNILSLRIEDKTFPLRDVLGKHNQWFLDKLNKYAALQ